ncbi:MAG: Uma2 family endonuclease, partial [Thiotrichales bacterium]
EDTYLNGEAQSPRKQEYVAGEVYAMAGASARHNRISGNVFVLLDAATRGTPCETFIADMKIKVANHRAFYYPDVMLCCDKDDDHPLYRSQPCLIVEVLSPATAGIDEREKWLHYRDIPSLRYYLLLDSEQRRARVRIREGDGWLEQTLDAEDIVPIICGPVHSSICLDDIYDRTGL